jgi:hypothetical protein
MCWELCLSVCLVCFQYELTSFNRQFVLSLVVGGYIVGSCFVSVLSLTAALIWGEEAETINELVDYEQNGHNITANQSLLSTFSIMSGLASFLFLCSVCNVFLLVISREFYSDYNPDVNTAPTEIYYQQSAGKSKRKISSGREWKAHGSSPTISNEVSDSSTSWTRPTSITSSYQHQTPLLEETEEESESESDSEGEMGSWNGVETVHNV